MKSKSLICVLALLMLLAGCAAKPEQIENTENKPQGDTDVPEEMVETFRVMDCGSSSDLILAKLENSGIYDVYFLPKSAFEGDPEVGMALEITYSLVLTSFPGRLEGVTAVREQSDQFNDLCTLYLQVMEDLWNTDSGLNGSITKISTDLSKTRLTPGEQGAISYLAGCKYKAQSLNMTFEELEEAGEIDEDILQWEDGLLFSITEKKGSAANKVCFDAEKWRSGLGAYYFMDCTAKAKDGHWNAYKVGAEAIS